MYVFKRPFVSPAEDRAMEGVSASGVRWAVYDTFCKDFGPKEKAQADREILDVFIRAEQRKQIAERMKEQE